MQSFFRYPGGKYKLITHILAELAPKLSRGQEYREPFYGGGSVGLNVIQALEPKHVWLNDGDPALADLWTGVIRDHERLKSYIREFEPSVQMFYDIKKSLSKNIGDSNEYDSLRGFMRLAIQQISYSGLGVMSGGPLGGRNQESQYKIDCRWSPDYLCRRIDSIHQMLSSIEFKDNQCTALDFEKLISAPSRVGAGATLYLDPPYFDKGGDLYQFGFKKEDHRRLRNALLRCKHRWVLSYDDHPEIIDMYLGCSVVKRIEGVNYSITAVRDRATGQTTSRTKSELLITSLV